MAWDMPMQGRNRIAYFLMRGLMVRQTVIAKIVLAK